MLLFYTFFILFPLLKATAPTAGTEPEDLTIKFVEPLEQTTKLLKDIELQVRNVFITTRKVVPDKVPAGASLAPVDAKKTELMPKNSDKFEIEVPSIDVEAPLPASVIDKPKEDNVASAIMNLQELDKKLGSTFKDLRSRKRYILAAMVRQMQTTVKNVRSNMVRTQSQFALAQTASKQTTTFGRPLLGGNQTDAEREKLLQENQDIISDVEERIQNVSKRINEIVQRLSQSLVTPNTSDEPRQPLNPITTLNTIINHQKTVTRAMMHARN